MIRIQAGVNDGNPGTGSGVAQIPNRIGTAHLGGDSHVWGVLPTGGDHLRRILSFQHHILHTWHLADIRQFTIGDIGRDQVCCQGQVPDHIQFLPVQDGLGNGGGDRNLLCLQRLPVDLGSRVLGNALGGKSRFYCRLLVQYDGYPDHIRIRVQAFFRQPGSLIGFRQHRVRGG